MVRYAKDTKVSQENSCVEIMRIVTRYGATGFGVDYTDGKAIIGFRMKGKFIRLALAMPDKNSDEIKNTPSGRYRPESQRKSALEQSMKQRWRVLALMVKAKLEAVESGITTIEEQFFGSLLLPNGKTVAEHVGPMVERAYQTGEIPALLPFSGGKQHG